MNKLNGLRTCCALSALAMVSACGGGGGGGSVISTPAPVATPAPTAAPAPTPTPTPAPASTTSSSFDTAEYRRSDGPSYHGASTAWTAGATGQGVKIGVIDSGIDMTSPEFAGRIDSASADVAGNRTIQQEDDHGTQVAMTAAAARNGTGIMGIAYNASIVALRADTPGSCATAKPNDPASGCQFADPAIARGIDRAVAAGAAVINISLGGDSASQAVLDAVRRASAAGVVVVVAAGNSGDGSDPAINPNNPDPFASALRDAGGTNVIIAGSVDDQGKISSFSNRAGNQADWYLTALGEGVCCVYKDGTLLLETTPSGTFATVVLGTSFSAPQISGAVALLKQAFPNLTGAQMVELLLKTARDAGAIGIDSTYGRGILDIAAAFAPRGTTTLAGSTTQVALGDASTIGSSAMGDALSTAAPLGAVVLDSYERAYSVDLAQGMRRASLQPRLLGAIDGGTRRVGGAGPALAMAFTVADGAHGSAPLHLTQGDAEAARVLAARVALRIAPNSQVGFTYRESADGLVAQMQGHEEPAFLIANSARGDGGFAQATDSALAWRYSFGRWGVTASGASGKAWSGGLHDFGGAPARQRETHGIAQFELTADRRFGALETALGLTWLNESGTVLGALLNPSLGANGARTLFADASAGWNFAPGWRAGGAIRQGWTRADTAGLVAGGSALTSRAWSADISRTGVFGAFDRLGLRVSQPLRVASGGLALNLPVAWDYATRSATYGVRTLSLAPGGREIDGELAWSGALLGGEGSASLYYRTDPGHIAAMPDDKGVALKWNRRF